MNEPASESGAGRGSWMAVAIAWILVGIPLLWGIYMTIRKAAPLFR